MKKYKDFDKDAQRAIREAYFQGRRDVERETYVIISEMKKKLERARAALKGTYIKPKKENKDGGERKH